MVTFTLVNRANLEGSTRIDAQYYQSLYSSNRDTFERLRCINLGKITSVFRKGIFDIKASSYTKEGVPFVRISDLKNGLIDDSSISYIPKDLHVKESKTSLQRGDIILSKTAYPAASLMTLEICNVSQDTIAVKLSDYWKNKLKSGYVVAFLNSRFGLLLLEQWFQGNIQMHLALPDAKRVPIPLLTNTFQACIDDLWWDASKLYDSSKLKYREAEKLLLSELGLQGWKPIPTLFYTRKYSQASRARRIDAEHFQPKYQEMLDRLSPSVRLERLGKLTTYTKGVEVGGPAYTDAGIPFWRVSNLTKYGIVDTSVNFISDELYNSLRSSYEPQQGEMLLSKDATPGLAYYLERPVKSIVSSGILRLSLVDSIPPHYLELALNSLFVQLQVEQDAGGSVIKHWKPSEVRKTFIPRLSSDRENEITELVRQSHAARRKAKTILEKAKRAVEIAIEEGEDSAMEFIR